jgi:hypothetical protein
MKQGFDINNPSAGTVYPPRATAVVAKNMCIPRNAETEVILTLIGKPLTRFELQADNTVRLEFGQYGAINIKMQNTLDIHTSVA